MLPTKFMSCKSHVLVHVFLKLVSKLSTTYKINNSTKNSNTAKEILENTLYWFSSKICG